MICLLLSNLSDLQSLPGVASAKVAVKCDAPKLTIIHVRDEHFIERMTFALDVQNASGESLTDDEVDNAVRNYGRDPEAADASGTCSD
jgi:hypothetical protein